MKKKELAVITVFALIVLFTGCGDGSSNNLSTVIQSVNAATNDTGAKVGPLVNGSDFSDGVAWVYVRGEEGTAILIDKTGRVLFRLEMAGALSGFSHGVAFVTGNELIDKTGKVISSTKSGEYDRIVSFIPELGMIVVEKNINTFELTETQRGIINNKGNWQIPLRGGELNGSISYLGDGFIRSSRRVKNSSGNYDVAPRAALYDVFTGEVHEGTWTSVINFENGHGIYRGRSSLLAKSGVANEQYSIFSTDTKGNTSEILYSGVTYGEYREGLFYNEVRGGEKGFYDIKGNKVIDLSKYNIVRESIIKDRGYDGRIVTSNVPFFTDGYCVLPLSRVCL